MGIKAGYKQTEIGIIPDDWEIKKLGELSKIERGKFSARPRNDPKYYGGETPFLQTGDIVRSKGKISTFSQSLNKEGVKVSRVFPAGTLFFTIAANIGDVGITNFATACPDSLVAISPKPHVSKEWLLYELSSRKKDFENISSLSAQLNINLEKLRPYLLPVPKESEQKDIAKTLLDVDELLEGLDELIAKKNSIKQIFMKQVLDQKIRLPGFSGYWIETTIAELEQKKSIMLSRGQVISKKNIDKSPGDFPIYSSSIHNNGLFGHYGNFMFNEELITWSVDGGGNFFYRPKHKFSITNVCGFMRVDTSQIDYRFLAAELQLLHTKKNYDYQSKAHPSVIRKEYILKLPDLKEQRAISNILYDIDSEIETLISRRNKTSNLKQAIMHELLTGKTRLAKQEEINA
jgi:type I restriction enzyme, S subunit